MGHVVTGRVDRILDIRMTSENLGPDVLLVFQIHCLGVLFYCGGRGEERE